MGRLFFHLSIDQVTGENINSNATAYWARLVEPCVQTGTQWATVFGNHGEKSLSDVITLIWNCDTII